MSMTGQVASGVRWGALDTIVAQGARLAITVVLARLILPEDFGLVVMAMVITQLASLVGDLGFGPALVQRKEIEDRHVSTALVVTTLVGVFMWGAVAVGSGAIASLYSEPRLEPIVAALGATFLFRGVVGVPRDLLRRAMRFDLIAISSIASVLSGGLVGIAMALSGGGAWSLVASMLVEVAVQTVLLPVFAARRAGWGPNLHFDQAAFGEMWRFSASVSAARFVHYGSSNIDNFIVGKVLGAASLGIYNIAYRLMLFPILKVAEVVANVSTPAFAKLQDEPQRLASAYRKAIVRVSLVCFPISVGTAVTAPVLVPAVFGNNWLAAIPVVQVLAINGMRLGIARMSGVVYEATGKPHIDLIMLSVTFVLYVFGFLIGVNWDVIGVAWAFTIVGFVMLPIDMYVVHRVMGASPISSLTKLVSVAIPTAFLAGSAFAILRAVPSAWSDLAVSVVAVAGAGLVYVAVSLVASRELIQTIRDLRTRG